MKIKDIAALIESVAPLQLQEGYDNAGLQVGDPEQEVSGILTTLDVTEESVRLAIESGANLIVSHHPLLFRGTKQINPRRDYISRVIIEAIRHDIAIYSAHTNLDNAPRGVNWRMCQILGLQNVRPLAPLSSAQKSGLAPEFAASCGSGMIGTLPVPITVYEFVQLVKERFSMPAVMANSEDVEPSRMVHTVALCGGAGDDFILDAIRAGADAYLTGEVSYHLYFGHPELFILCGGHYETEQFTCQLLRDIIAVRYPDLKIVVASSSSPIVVY